jgi:hypothetical protein
MVEVLEQLQRPTRQLVVALEQLQRPGAQVLNLPHPTLCRPPTALQSKPA